MEIKLKRHLVIECRLIKGIGCSFGIIAIVVGLWQQIQRLSYRAHSKETAITTAAASPVSADGCSTTPSPVWIQSESEIKKVISPLFGMENVLLGRSRSGVGVGVGFDILRPESELESESPKICRLCSTAYNVIC